ncbi:PrgI family protein [Candidatus Saccharibacteria bacterium]|nr:PrgI family protein [Candidatus Saccharibacteria bacterium]
MAVYKVIQDIESEDKLLGPLTLKGFIYAVIAGLCAFIDFRLVLAPDVGSWRWLVILLLVLPMALFGVLASPLGRQQPTEVWLLAHLRFLVKPRQRLWDQTGISKLVSITAPKKIAKLHTKGLSETEVRSRLQTLTATLDSRGWAIKNLNLQPNPAFEAMSDRLVAPNTLNQAAIDVDINPADDIMDEKNNPTAQYFSGLMQQQDDQRRKKISHTISAARTQAALPVEPTITADSASTTAAAADGNDQNQAGASASSSPVTATARADKLELAQSGNDLSVASIARLANRKNAVQQIGPNEVVISLH